MEQLLPAFARSSFLHESEASFVIQEELFICSQSCGFLLCWECCPQPRFRSPQQVPFRSGVAVYHESRGSRQSGQSQFPYSTQLSFCLYLTTQCLCMDLDVVAGPMSGPCSVAPVMHRSQRLCCEQDNFIFGKLLRIIVNEDKLMSFPYRSPMFFLQLCLLLFEFSISLPVEVLLQSRAAVYLALAVFYNIMACRVFRLLRLVDPSETGTVMQTSEIIFRPNSRLSDV